MRGVAARAGCLWTGHSAGPDSGAGRTRDQDPAAGSVGLPSRRGPKLQKDSAARETDAAGRGAKTRAVEGSSRIGRARTPGVPSGSGVPFIWARNASASASIACARSRRAVPQDRRQRVVDCLGLTEGNYSAIAHLGVSLLREVQAGFHPPRYAALLNPPSPRFGHSSDAQSGGFDVAMDPDPVAMRQVDLDEVGYGRRRRHDGPIRRHHLRHKLRRLRVRLLAVAFAPGEDQVGVQIELSRHDRHRRPRRQRCRHELPLERLRP